MEGLDNRQIVLLTLLVSFVTSIATGIVTVSLLEQAPAGVTQTINRVVEKTVETVAPTETKVIEVVKEVPADTIEQKITDVVEKRASALVAVVIRDATDASNVITSERSGFLVSSDGLIITSGKAGTNNTYEVLYADGTRGEALYIADDAERNVLVLKIDSKKDEGTLQTISQSIGGKKTPFIPFVELKPALGQSVISISRSSLGIAVRDGLISSIKTGSESNPLMIETDIRSSDRFIGAPVMSLSGTLLGVVVEQGQYGTNVLPTSVISQFLSEEKSVSFGDVSGQSANAGDAI